jgi:hypothetical protein
MTDIHDMRTRLRESRAAPAVSHSEGSRIPFGLVAVAAVAVGFAIVVVTPKLYSVQRTATLPGFKDVRERVEEPAAAPAPAPVPAGPPVKADYVGKSPEEIAGIADLVCQQRSAAAKANAQQTPRLASDDASGVPKLAAENEKLQCFLSEGTARFCVPAQRRKATADVINYFKGVEYANASVGVMQKAMSRPGGGGDASAAASMQLAPDPQVVEAIEGLLRAGYIAQGYRDDILSNVPRLYKERFARIVGNRVPCPEKPWWQVWK